VVSVVVGCDVNRLTGERGEAVFVYYSGEDHGNFNKPLATGATLRVDVETLGGEEVDVRAATAHDLARVRVGEVAGDEVALEGVSPGFSLVTVEAMAPGLGVVRDRVRLRVDDVREVAFKPEYAHDPDDGLERVGEALVERMSWRGRAQVGDVPREIAARTNARVEIPWTRLSATGEPLVGEGVRPFEIVPRGGIVVEEAGSDALTLRMPSVPGSYVVRPAVGVAGEPFGIEVYGGTLRGELSARAVWLEQLVAHGTVDLGLRRLPLRWRLAIVALALLWWWWNRRRRRA
jgi:hypothetical protein